MTLQTQKQLELLLSYTPQQRRDAWIVLGRAEANVSLPTYYAEGSLYRLNCATNLNEFIIFVKERVTQAFPWNDYHYVNGVIQRIHDQLIPSQFEVILTSAEYPSETTYPPDLSFVPFPIDSNPTTVLMEDYELERIMLEAGVPFIRFEEMEYTKEQIKYLIIRPVIEEYYKWFPIYRSEVYQIGRSFSIPFPKEATGVKRVIGANSLNNIGAGYQNPFMYAHELNQGAMFGGMPSSAFASHNYSRNQILVTMLAERSVRQGVINEFTTLKWDAQDRVVKGYYLGGNRIQIDWTYLSNDWSVIPLRRLDEVRKLATARILRAFAMLRSQISLEGASLPNYDRFYERANEMEKEVLDAWKEFTKVAIMRIR